MKSFSSPKATTARHRSSQSISGYPLPQETQTRFNTSKLKGHKTPELLDSKISTNYDRARTSNSPQPHHHALRDLSNLVGESLLISNLASPDLSLTNALNEAIPTPGGSQRKLVEEVNMLKKEIEQKNSMIDKLMKENLNLRKEMEEFLTTVDEAREYIDVELKECNNRIHELETEIQELRTENEMYKEQLSKRMFSVTSETPRENIFEEDVDGYYGQAKKEMEDFYFRLNEQIINFMEISKKQYQDFNRIINTKVPQNREETIKTCPSSPKRENTSSSSAVKSTGPKPARTRNSSMSISCKIQNPKSPQSLKNPMTPKTPKMLGDTKDKTPKGNGDTLSNRSIDLRCGTQSSASRKRGSCTSMSRLEVDAGNSGIGLSGEVSGQRNPTSHALSPKSSLLRAKLKSDMILQEMRRKIGEGLAANV